MKAELTFDLMELSEVGARPDKQAGEILRQVRAQCGELPLPIPIMAIATALGIESVEERDTDTFEGALVALPDKSRGTVVLRKGLTCGRRNFTFGHELGHFVNPYHRPPTNGFYCNSHDLAERRQGGRPWKERSPFERMEVEANEFSSFLNVPRQEFRNDLKRLSDPDVRHIVNLADRYSVSKEMMAQIYITEVPEKLGIVTSHGGRISRCILPTNFPYLGLRKGQPIPHRSATVEFAKKHSSGAVSELRSVPADVWLDRSPDGVTVCEQVLLQREGWAMTMIVIEDAEEDEGDAATRTWYEPKFSYNR